MFHYFLFNNWLIFMNSIRILLLAFTKYKNLLSKLLFRKIISWGFLHYNSITLLCTRGIWKSEKKSIEHNQSLNLFAHFLFSPLTISLSFLDMLLNWRKKRKRGKIYGISATTNHWLMSSNVCVFHRVIDRQMVFSISKIVF